VAAKPPRSSDPYPFDSPKKGFDLAVRIRLTRVGARNNPIWRVVATDQRSPRDGRFIEVLGHYNPQTEPSTIELDEERVRTWIQKGAQPTQTVKKLMKAKGIAA
jgi:small subunit ribosomal protein S16